MRSHSLNPEDIRERARARFVKSHNTEEFRARARSRIRVSAVNYPSKHLSYWVFLGTFSSKEYC